MEDSSGSSKEAAGTALMSLSACREAPVVSVALITGACRTVPPRAARLPSPVASASCLSAHREITGASSDRLPLVGGKKEAGWGPRK